MFRTILPFFELAGRSASRRRAFLQLVLVHILCLAVVVVLGVWSHSERIHRPIELRFAQPKLIEWLGWTLLAAGIVEGALLVGWRLTQLPKSQALESLLLSPAPAWQTLLGEQLVGLSQLVLISLSSVPILAWLSAMQWLRWEEAIAVVGLGLGWGTFVGVGLAWWAFEPAFVRRIGEKVMLAGMAGFLLFFGIFSERSQWWLGQLPFDIGRYIELSLRWTNVSNPFDLVHRIAVETEPMVEELFWMAGFLFVASTAMAVRTSLRLKGHYLERCFRSPIDPKKHREPIGNRPVAWWAVKRVNEYPGKVNLYLAAGAAALYAVYLVVGDQRWPAAFGRNIFQVYEAAGGVAGFTTVLALLAAVPAAYQYGLWDSSLPDRCKRLEALLPTQLDAVDYLHASLRASWNRGRGYFATAMLLWMGAAAGGRMTPETVLAAVAMTLVLFLFYFAVGFRMFASARGNTSLGFALTVGLPLVAWGLGGNGLPLLASITPPGAVYYSMSPTGDSRWFFLLLASMSVASLLLIWQAVQSFDSEIRRWYDRNLGRVV